MYREKSGFAFSDVFFPISISSSLHRHRHPRLVSSHMSWKEYLYLFWLTWKVHERNTVLPIVTTRIRTLSSCYDLLMNKCSTAGDIGVKRKWENERKQKMKKAKMISLAFKLLPSLSWRYIGPSGPKIIWHSRAPESWMMHKIRFLVKVKPRDGGWPDLTVTGDMVADDVAW